MDDKDKPVLIERTSKEIKKWYVVGWILVIVGMATSCGDTAHVEWGFALTLIGVVMLIATRLQQWWRHG